MIHAPLPPGDCAEAQEHHVPGGLGGWEMFSKLSLPHNLLRLQLRLVISSF